MKVFINDIPVKISKMEKEFDREDFDVVIDCLQEKEIHPDKLIGDVIILNSSSLQLERVLDLMRSKKLKNLHAITFKVKDRKSVIQYIKTKFKVIEAAGGVVVKDDKFLFIHRLGNWDLPKGKLNKKETPREAAIREVEEECSVKVELDGKITSTWHTYNLNGSKILKKTYWFKMTCLDDRKMKPQKEEDIDDIRWMNRQEARVALHSSYQSIRAVFDKFYKKYYKE